MKYKLLQLIKLDTLELFMENLTQLVKIPLSIMDAEGEVVVATNQGFCESYNKGCTKNNGSCKIKEYNFEEIFHKEFGFIDCENKAVRFAVPITVKDQHLATFVSGEFVINEFHLALLKSLSREDFLNNNEIEMIDNELITNLKSIIKFKDMMSSIMTRHAIQLDIQETLEINENRFNLVIEGSNDIIWEWDIQSGEFFVSDKWENLTGYKLPKQFNFFIELSKIIYDKDLAIIDKALETYINKQTDDFECEYRIKTKAGEIKWVLQKGKILKNENDKHILMAGSITDITYKKIYEDEIKYLAYNDVMTNLPNRIFFEKKLNEELNKSYNDKSKLDIAFYFIDLDDFKKINDNHGHEAGDEFLAKIASLIKSKLSEKQILCRFGGDEFLLADLEGGDMGKIRAVAEELLLITEKPVSVHEKLIYPSFSIGIASHNEESSGIDDLINYSDIAMYEAKKNGKNTYVIFDQKLHEKYVRDRRLEADLDRAIKNNEFTIHYQPQIDIENKKIYGIEALLRWQHPELGLLTPYYFIDIIENSDKIKEIGKLTIKQACITSKKLEVLGYDDVVVSVNLCEKQLMDEEFLSSVTEIFKALNINRKNICFEITERILVNEDKVVLNTLNELRAIGVEVFIDDFGTKYSSLNYLNIFNVSGIKIDKAFIDKINSSKKDYIITKNIIKLTRDLELEVIAEGVENEEQCQCLKEIDCANIQGYLFSKPISYDNMVNYICEFNPD